jgi:hypothetical protein
MKTGTTKPSPDLSRLTPAQRRNYEAGLALVSKRLALAQLEEARRLARPKSFRIVPPQPHALEARKPGARPAPRRTGKPAAHVVFVTLFE